MGKRHIEFLFDLTSPAANLAYTQVPRLAERTGAVIWWQPVLLGGLMRASGNSSPLSVMERWAQRYGVPLCWPSPFPIPGALIVMRAAIVARQQGLLFPFISAVFEAIWSEGRDLGKPHELSTVAECAGVEPKCLLSRLSDPEVKRSLRKETEQAATRGAFGVPTIFVGDSMFFGQDRLDFVAEALSPGHPIHRHQKSRGRHESRR
jgi:2-hydroxychromene-2-carboxylate isomerase